ncbi:MAG: class I SAM-dependent methyltransferase [Pseudomonadota bacterium]
MGEDGSGPETTRGARRRLEMGLETLQGGRAQGFFSPYRYADLVAAPGPYPELEALFHAAEPSMGQVLDRIDTAVGALASLNGPPPVPRWDQSWFPRLDGAAAFVIVRESTPRQIIEVGSGHSTRMLAHAAEGCAAITCIDPQPRADLSKLQVQQERRVLAPGDVEMFRCLDAGDIAFFDSSHILWPGTDVDMIFNRILPVLAPGVLVHIHDILLPDPYPEDWAWRGYTEQNGLAGWLHGVFEIVFASHYAVTRMAAAARPGVAALPMPEGARETSLWLRRR